MEFDRDGKAVSIEEKARNNQKATTVLLVLYFYDNRVVDYAGQLKSRAGEGELEITDLNRIYLEEGLLNVELLGRVSHGWIPAPMKSLVDATNFCKKQWSHQHRKIACLEEIAY